MSRPSNQDDLFVPWDDFSATQLENVEEFVVSKKNSNPNDENQVDNQNSFLLNSSKATLDDFLDELLGLPTKSTPTLRAPLGDISNTRQQKHNTSIKEKEQKRHPTPTLTRMDSVDDSIWVDFDTDLLSLIDPILPNKKKNTTSIPSKNATPTHEKTSIDDKFLLKQQNDKAPCPGFTTARGFALPSPSKEAKLKAARLLEAVDKEDDILLPLSIDENLFVPLTESKEDLSPICKETGQSDSSLFENSDLSLTSIATPVYKLEPIIKDGDDCTSVSSYDDVFLPLSSKYKPLPPPGTSQPKHSTSDIKLPLSPPIDQNELSSVSEPKIEKITSKSIDDLVSPSILVDESLFLPQVTEDGHIIKLLPTPTGPAAGFQSAKLIESEHTNKTTPKEDHNSLYKNTNHTSIPRVPKPMVTSVKPSSTNIPKKPFTPSFMTASGTKLKEPSAKGIQKALSLFEDTETPTNFDAVIHQYGGFKMGNSKKSFDISSQAKRKAISAFDESKAEMNSKKIHVAMDNVSSSSTSMFPKRKVISAFDESETGIDSKKIHVAANNVSSSSISMFPKRNSNRPAAMHRQNKPFKSPIIKSNIELTKAAVNNRSSLKVKLTPVFNLEVPDFRFKLSTLGAPGTFTRSQLIANNIPISIINMTISTAKRYVFDGNWGAKEALRDMIEAGTLPRRMTIEWVENHYALIVWKIACLIRSYNQFMDRWKPQAILEQLLYRYEREINMGNRPVLRRILEKDDLPVKHMILMITDIAEIRSAIQYNTSSKYQLQLSDGWYQVPACIDLRIEKSIIKKKLKIGSKLSICGASIIGDKEGINPLENTDNSAMLSITANSSLPARWHTKLGYHPRKFIIRSLPSIFYDGGIVTAIDIVVCRKFPIMYNETLPNGSSVTRNAKEEEEARRIALGYDSYGVRQHTPGSKSAALVERRVSGYFKIRICDHISPVNQQWATLLLSNANELNHMDISEGNRYKIFFVVPYHPKNKKYPGLDIKTTRVTRWEPAPTLNLLNSYMARSLTKCGDIQYKDPSSDFDLVVLVLQTGPSTLEVLNGRKLWKQTLLVSDESQSICQVNFRLPINPFPDIKGQVLGLLNLRYGMYDGKFDITCLKATDEAESVSKVSAAAEYVQKGILNLKRWVNDYPDKVQRLHDRVENIQ